MFALPAVGADRLVGLNEFSTDPNVEIKDDKLSLIVDGSSGETIYLNSTQNLEKFTLGENGDYWEIVDGRAKVQMKPNTNRLPDGQKYELKITRETDSLEFEYGVSSEKDYDWFMVKKGDEVIFQASDEVQGVVTKEFPKGTYEFAFLYKKDECGRSKQDTAYLEYVKFGGSATKTASVETALKFGNGQYRWDKVEFATKENVTVRLATSNDGVNRSSWINYTDGKPNLSASEYLHIQLNFSSGGEPSRVGGIKVSATSVPSIGDFEVPVRVREKPTLTWKVYREGQDVTSQATGIQVRASKNAGMAGATTKPVSDGSGSFTWPDALADGEWYFGVKAKIDGVETNWSDSKVIIDATAPTVDFSAIDSKYPSSPTLKVTLKDELSDIKTGTGGSKVELYKGNTNQNKTFTTSGSGKTVTFTGSNLGLLNPGYYTIKVTAIDELGNQKTSSKEFFLGDKLTIEPSNAVVPKDTDGLQGFQFYVTVGGQKKPLVATEDLNKLSISRSDVNPGSFDPKLNGPIQYFNPENKEGSAILQASIAGLTATANVSTGSGNAAEIESWPGVSGSVDIEVFTPGGIKIAEYKNQTLPFIWDGIANYGKHAGLQGLTGIYLFKTPDKGDIKELLKEDTTQIGTLTVSVTGQSITCSRDQTGPVYASAFIKDSQNNKIRWLGTKLEDKSTSSWTWDGKNDAGQTVTEGSYKAYVQLVTPGGDSQIKSATIQALEQGAGINRFMGMAMVAEPEVVTWRTNEDGQYLEDENWEYQYENGLLKMQKGKNGEGTYTYFYDYEGRRIRTELDGALSTEVSYDGDGKKVKEVSYSQDKKITTYFAYDKDEYLVYEKIITEENGKITEIEKNYDRKGGLQ
jgi:hypothetical protein